MGKITEKEIIAFEFLKEICKEDEEVLVFSDHTLSREKRKKRIARTERQPLTPFHA